MPPSFAHNPPASTAGSPTSATTDAEASSSRTSHRHRHHLCLSGRLHALHHGKSHTHSHRHKPHTDQSRTLALPKLKSKAKLHPQPLEMEPVPVAPSELVVLSHGLQGTVEDFTYLLEKLGETQAAKEGKLLVHSSSVNTNKTHDGIELGGLRLSEDIREVVEEHKDSLRTISLMGFSLGGMYIRYAAAHLYNPEDGTIAGLEANKIIIVASPNLGVRKFGVYRFIPGWMSAAAASIVGSTTQQLLLRDERQLLMEMSADRPSRGMEFISALRAFRYRYLYANVRNDFMVNYGTAALDASVKVIGAPDVEQVVPEHGDIVKVDEAHDDRGCKICFEVKYDAEPEEGESSSRTGAAHKPVEDELKEEVMGARLKRLGWTVIGVDFPMSVPIAHNRIVAMSRNKLHTWMNAGGRRVVHHLVDTFAKDFEEPEPKFSEVTISSSASNALTHQ